MKQIATALTAAAAALTVSGCTTAHVEGLPVVTDVRSPKGFREVAGCIVLALSKNRSLPVKTIERPNSVTITESVPINFTYSTYTVIDVEAEGAGSRLTMHEIRAKEPRPLPEALAPCV